MPVSLWKVSKSFWYRESLPKKKMYIYTAPIWFRIWFRLALYHPEEYLVLIDYMKEIPSTVYFNVNEIIIQCIKAFSL